jgi:hypothetical protein
MEVISIGRYINGRRDNHIFNGENLLFLRFFLALLWLIFRRGVFFYCFKSTCPRFWRGK